MGAVQVDVGAGSAVLVSAFRFEGDGLAGLEQGFGAGLDLLAECVFGRTLRGIARFRAVPPDEAQADPLCPAIRQALQLKRIAIDGYNVTRRSTDAAGRWCLT